MEAKDVGKGTGGGQVQLVNEEKVAPSEGDKKLDESEGDETKAPDESKANLPEEKVAPAEHTHADGEATDGDKTPRKTAGASSSASSLAVVGTSPFGKAHHADDSDERSQQLRALLPFDKVTGQTVQDFGWKIGSI